MKTYALRLAGALTYYASVQNDPVLKAQAHLVDSDFTKARDDLKDDVAQRIYDLANPLVTSLAGAGVTAGTMSASLTRIDAYRLSISTPSTARSDRRSFNSCSTWRSGALT